MRQLVRTPQPWAADQIVSDCRGLPEFPSGSGAHVVAELQLLSIASGS